jgi:hypothetical protein
LVRQRHPAILILAVAFGPYLVLDFLFQESITTRYALPLVVPVAFAAAWGLVALGWTGALIGAVFLVAFDAHVGGTSVAAYAREPAPAFRLLGDMRNEAGRETPVLAMHRREDLDLRRPIAWVGAAMPLSTRLSAPPKREWLELVEYWNSGGRQSIWFVADPLRTDLALIDRRDASVTRYRWQLEHHALIGGVRPDVMDWYRFGEPAWYLGEGWALTPETGGVAKEAGYGPGNGPIQGWILRSRQSATVMLGGRNLAASGPATHVRMSIDGRTIAEPAVAPGFFLTMLHVPESALKGSDEYARVELTAESSNIAIEQFDAQPSDRVLFGFADGWHEQEYDPALGLQWRWISERGLLRVHAGGHSLLLSLRAEAPSVYFSNPSRVTVRAGARMVFEQPFSSAVEIVARIPAELVAGDESTITIESSQMYVPAERSRRTRDRRHLALRVFECSVREAR